MTTDSPEVLERFHSQLSLVETIAAHIRRSVGASIEFDDLVGAGREGLLDAARRFDASRGVPFGVREKRHRALRPGFIG